jgi:hypothetical protein
VKSSELETIEATTPRYLTLNPEYVTGFCDGEASFTYSRQRGNLRLRFSVTLHEEDKALIFALQSFFGVGGVYWREGRWTYCVTRFLELRRITEHFTLFPLKGKKAESFDVWKRMYELKRPGSPSTNSGELADLASQLSALTTKGPKSVKPWWTQHG